MPYKYNVFTGKLDYYTTASGCAGQTNTMTNLGGGEGVYYQKDGVQFQMKSLVGGDNITLTSDNATITISGGAGGGVSDHSLLSNLDYASAGHTGFQPAGDYITNTQLTTTSGDIVSQIPSDFYSQSEITTISGDIVAQIPSDYISDSEMTTISGDIISQIPTDYYTTGEVDTISGVLNVEKSDIGHTHTESDVTDLGDYATTGELTTASGDIITYVDTHYETIYIDAAAMVPCTTSGALAGTYEYSINDIDLDYFAFDAGAIKERIQFKYPKPEGWDRGTIKAKFYWSSATGSTTGDTVEFGIKVGALSDSDAIDTALGTPQVISDVLLADNGADLQITDSTSAITVGGSPALGDMLVFEIYRNTDGTDTMAEDGHLFGVWIQYKVDSSVSAW